MTITSSHMGRRSQDTRCFIKRTKKQAHTSRRIADLSSFYFYAIIPMPPISLHITPFRIATAD